MTALLNSIFCIKTHQVLLDVKFDFFVFAELFISDDKNEKKSQEVLRELENIDEEADEADLPFVRIDDKELAADYGFDTELPVLVYFEKRIPSVYHGIND